MVKNMKAINRKKAIREIYWLASRRGWKYNELHHHLNEELGINSLSASSAKKLTDILRHFGNFNVLVKENNLVYLCLQEATRNNISEMALHTICVNHFPVKHLYQMNKDQLRGLLKVINYIKEKQKLDNAKIKKIKGENENN